MDPTVNALVMVATAATALFTGWAVWQRWRYTPRPHWLDPMIANSRRPQAEGDPGSIEYQIANRGDATAMDVRVSVKSGDEWQEVKVMARVDAGDDVLFWHTIPATYPGMWDPRTDKWDRPLIWTWESSQIRIRWRQHPRLKQVRSQTMDLPRPEDVP